MLLYLMSERHETIGLAAHRGDNHHHLMPECLEFCDASRDVLDAFRTADRCSAVLLNYECHVFSMPDLKRGAILAQLAEKDEARSCYGDWFRIGPHPGRVLNSKAIEL